MKITIRLCFALLLLAVAAVKSAVTGELNARPIIGIVVKEIHPHLEKTYPGKYKSYIPASFVKFIEGGGARVVPVWLGQDEKYYKDIVKKTNGIMFPSGQLRFGDKCGSADASVTLYNLATEENKRGNYFPIFGIDHGMETLVYAATDKDRNYVKCAAKTIGFSLKFKPDFKSSKLFKPMPDKLIDALKNENITSSFQWVCLTEAKLKELKLSENWRVLSTNHDEKNVEFISSLEHKTFPFYAVQFRPEKNLYEWKSKRVAHSLNAVLSSQYFAAFFVQEARKSRNKFESIKAEQKELIYNYPTVYTRKDGHYYEQCYMFEAEKGTTC